MSSGNILQGQSSGKLGDVVLMVRNGEQVARVYTKAGARTGDQVSEAARIQRVKFGSASNQWGLYRYVSTRMYRKGRKTNQSDYNYFVKKNNTLFPYLTKAENANGVHVAQPGVFSEGNLGRLEIVYVYNPQAAVGSVMFRVLESQSAYYETVNWVSNVSALKAMLRLRYPNARKFTYLLSIANDLEIAEEGASFVSQVIQHYPVTFDLYSELTPGEDSTTIASYFTSRISNAKLNAVINAQTAGITLSSAIFRLTNIQDVDMTILDHLSVLAFATDDNVSDCYTTILPQTGIDPLHGIYSVWASYRTPESLRIAADSYGYQSGVMRDDIAAAGNEMRAQVQMYASKLRSLDVEAADDYLKSVGPVEQVQAKVVRKAAPAEDSK